MKKKLKNWAILMAFLAFCVWCFNYIDSSDATLLRAENHKQAETIKVLKVELSATADDRDSILSALSKHAKESDSEELKNLVERFSSKEEASDEEEETVTETVTEAVTETEATE